MFHTNFKNRRLACGLSQKQIADYLKITPQSVSKWENGDALPSIDYLPKLAECLNCDINTFFVMPVKKSYDIEMLKEFFDFATEMILHETKQQQEFQPILDKYPNILDIYKELGEELKQYKTVKRKNIQRILNCSESDTEIFLDYFLKIELLEKLDIDDSYFVLKDSIDGLRMVFIMVVEIIELSHNTKNWVYKKISQKINNHTISLCKMIFKHNPKDIFTVKISFEKWNPFKARIKINR